MVLDRRLFAAIAVLRCVAARLGASAAVAGAAQAGNDGELPRHGGRSAATGHSGRLQLAALAGDQVRISYSATRRS